ncbi:MAG: M20 family metallo-hydrolase [Cloacibacillus sp.]
MNEALMKEIESLEPQMVETLGKMIEYPAVSPKNGGAGEFHKAQYLLAKIKELGFDDVKVYASSDPLAAGGERPNLVVSYPGKTKRRLWFVSHTDVVPEGERSLWQTDPFKAVVKDGKIYGRGVLDNGQALVASLYALYAVKKLGIAPEYEICLALVADEEVGSKQGIQYLIKKGLFRADDLVLVPDMENEAGDFIEIAEKSILWAEFTVDGKQVHASTPQLGNNACRAANALSVALDEALHSAFPEEDSLFDPPVSTFEPTRRAQNVTNINTVPGREVFAFDCRVLPSVPLEEVEKVIAAEIKKVREKYGVTVAYGFEQREQAPAPTSPDAEAVKLLTDAVKEIFPKVEPKAGGVGGGTCAAYFRAAGIPAAVWGQAEDCAHMPNEYSVIKYLTNNAKVFALMMVGK